METFKRRCKYGILDSYRTQIHIMRIMPKRSKSNLPFSRYGLMAKSSIKNCFRLLFRIAKKLSTDLLTDLSTGILYIVILQKRCKYGIFGYYKDSIRRSESRPIIVLALLQIWIHDKQPNTGKIYVKKTAFCLFPERQKSYPQAICISQTGILYRAGRHFV